LYIAEIKDIQMRQSKLSFMAVKEKASRDQESYEMVYGSSAEQLLQYSVCTLPPNGMWIDLRPGLSFLQELLEPNQEGENKIQKTTIKFSFRGDNPDGEKKIDQFIQVYTVFTCCT
jgi:hypothetical protein